MQNHTGGFLNPQKILRELPLVSGIKVADFGCGHGYFSLPLAKFVPDGKVYSIDVLDKALQAVRSQAEIEEVENIETIRGNLEKKNGSQLDAGSVDMVLLANILFQSENKEEIIEEADRVLKKDGKLVVIDWIPGSAMAPKESWLISKEDIRQMIQSKDFAFDQDLEMDNQHYGLIFNKNN
jgi:ubiquinone/menaquinone biosynthesis C-methylase UbiE